MGESVGTRTKKSENGLRILRDHTPDLRNLQDDMVRPPWRHGEPGGNVLAADPQNRSAVTKVNGPKVFAKSFKTIALVKTGQMRENPRILCYLPICSRWVTMHEMRTIRRKGRIGNDSESSETIRQSLAQAGEDIVRTAWRHAEDGRNDHPASRRRSREVVTASSEIPCRVSSDLHEWWNDRATVLANGSANLWFR